MLKLQRLKKKSLNAVNKVVFGGSFNLAWYNGFKCQPFFKNLDIHVYIVVICANLSGMEPHTEWDGYGDNMKEPRW